MIFLQQQANNKEMNLMAWEKPKECPDESYIPGVPKKKRNGGFSVPCELKVLYYFTPLDKASSAEEIDIKIIKFGSVILILCSFLVMQ